MTIIDDLKKNNYTIEKGKEGEVIFALANYAAEDSNFTTGAIGEKGKQVAEVCKILGKNNPAFIQILASAEPEAKQELKECRSWSRARVLREGARIRKAKVALMMLLLSLGIGISSLGAAPNVDTPEPHAAGMFTQDATTDLFRTKSLKLPYGNSSNIDIFLADVDDMYGGEVLMIRFNGVSDQDLRFTLVNNTANLQYIADFIKQSGVHYVSYGGVVTTKRANAQSGEEVADPKLAKDIKTISNTITQKTGIDCEKLELKIVNA